MTALFPDGVRLHDSVRALVGERAEGSCQDCLGTVYRLCKRQKRNLSWSIELQCVECGRSRSSPFPQAPHPEWQRYPEFDLELQQRWADRRASEREDKRAAMSDEYGEWLLYSEEWHELSARVRARSGGVCEACLEAKATEVHHTTYHYGRLPPAWELRAVCHICHSRFTSEGDDWGPRNA